MSAKVDIVIELPSGAQYTARTKVIPRTGDDVQLEGGKPHVYHVDRVVAVFGWSECPRPSSVDVQDYYHVFVSPYDGAPATAGPAIGRLPARRK